MPGNQPMQVRIKLTKNEVKPPNIPAANGGKKIHTININILP